MKTYTVHLFAVVRVKVLGVEAESQTAAIEHAEAAVDFNELFNRYGLAGGYTTPPSTTLTVEHTEYADEVVAALVDEADDPEFARSTCYDLKAGEWLDSPKEDPHV